VTLEQLTEWGRGSLMSHMGIEFTAAEPGRMQGRMPVRPEVMAANGYLHAASVIALADSSCAFGVMFDLPEHARGFTTIELKSNFTGTTRAGVVTCEAVRVHGGRTTQVWDATVRDQASGKTIALFRCTQLLLSK
jgi:uncharacterized protein (TIGR00369 family)